MTISALRKNSRFFTFCPFMSCPSKIHLSLFDLSPFATPFSLFTFSHFNLCPSKITVYFLTYHSLPLHFYPLLFGLKSFALSSFAPQEFTFHFLPFHPLVLHFFYVSICNRIRRAGYPIRHSFDVFSARYHMLVIGLGSLVISNPKEATKIIAQNAISDSDWQIGHSKIFLKVHQHWLIIRIMN